MISALESLTLDSNSAVESVVKLDGGDLFVPFVAHKDPEIVESACLVLGYLTHNNPVVCQLVATNGGMRRLYNAIGPLATRLQQARVGADAVAACGSPSKRHALSKATGLEPNGVEEAAATCISNCLYVHNVTSCAYVGWGPRGGGGGGGGGGLTDRLSPVLCCAVLYPSPVWHVRRVSRRLLDMTTILARFLPCWIPNRRTSKQALSALCILWRPTSSLRLQRQDGRLRKCVLYGR